MIFVVWNDDFKWFTKFNKISGRSFIVMVESPILAYNRCLRQEMWSVQRWRRSTTSCYGFTQVPIFFLVACRHFSFWFLWSLRLSPQNLLLKLHCGNFKIRKSKEHAKQRGVIFRRFTSAKQIFSKAKWRKRTCSGFW